MLERHVMECGNDRRSELSPRDICGFEVAVVLYSATAWQERGVSQTCGPIWTVTALGQLSQDLKRRMFSLSLRTLQHVVDCRVDCDLASPP